MEFGKSGISSVWSVKEEGIFEVQGIRMVAAERKIGLQMEGNPFDGLSEIRNPIAGRLLSPGESGIRKPYCRQRRFLLRRKSDSRIKGNSLSGLPETLFPFRWKQSYRTIGNRIADGRKSFCRIAVKSDAIFRQSLFGQRESIVRTRESFFRIASERHFRKCRNMDLSEDRGKETVIWFSGLVDNG